MITGNPITENHTRALSAFTAVFFVDNAINTNINVIITNVNNLRHIMDIPVPGIDKVLQHLIKKL